jgi:hypothetical protein
MMTTTSQLGDLNRWKRLRIAGTPLYKGLLMSVSESNAGNVPTNNPRRSAARKSILK